jgi:hypothetical protein
MKLAPLCSLALWAILLCIFALCPAPAPAENDVTEIRLGSAPPPKAAAAPGMIRAVERLYAERQTGSLGRGGGDPARMILRTTGLLADSVLFGPRGASLAAFEFPDGAVAEDGEGRFRVSVYLLFADDAGQVVESRDEDLTFSREGDGYVCTSLRATNVIVWPQDALREAAETLGATEELEQARQYLIAGSRENGRLSSYALSDIRRNANGAVVVRSQRFLSDPGKRGIEARQAPIVLSRVQNSIRIEPN